MSQMPQINMSFFLIWQRGSIIITHPGAIFYVEAEEGHFGLSIALSALFFRTMADLYLSIPLNSNGNRDHAP